MFEMIHFFQERLTLLFIKIISQMRIGLKPADQPLDLNQIIAPCSFRHMVFLFTAIMKQNKHPEW